MADADWNHFCNEDNLRFRAACYEAVPPAERPISRHVVRRLAQCDDTRAICEDLAASKGGPFVDEDAQFAALVAAPRWKALVAEKVDEAQRWSDFWDGLFKTPSSGRQPGPASAPNRRRKLKELSDWLADHGGLVISRAAGVAVTGSLSVILTLRLADKAGLEIPIHPKLEGGTLTLTILPSPNPVPVPVSISVLPNAPVPVSLSPSSPTPPSNTGGTTVVVGSAFLDPLVKATAQNGKQIELAAGGIGELLTAVNRLAKPASEVAADVRSVKDAVGRVQDSAQAGAAEAKQIREAATALHGAVGDTAKTLHADATGFAQSPIESAMTLTDGVPRRHELRWIGSRGEVSTCFVELSARPSAADAHVTVKALGPGCPFETMEATIAKGKSSPLGGLPFTIAVDSTRRRLLGARQTALSIQRVVGAQAPDREAANAAGSGQH